MVPLEKNVIRKNVRNKLRVALVYPNLYKAGMANLGIRILYDIFNSYEDIYCERFFLDFDKSLETNSYLKSFDVIAISWQYENDAINILRILKRNGIEIDRKRRDKLIIIGGPCTLNPLPLSKVSDVFFIGEAEEYIHKFIQLLIEYKNKDDIIEGLKNVEGYYIPEFGNKTRRVFVKDLNKYFPIKQLIPYESTFNSSFMLDISRGCIFNCKFCLGARIKPKRDRKLEFVMDILEKNLEINNIRKITLISASFVDYYKIDDLCKFLIEKNFNVSIPSIRADRLRHSILELLKHSKQNTLTIAPETYEDLRFEIGKRFTNEEIINVCKNMSKFGIKKLKMYFMLGLPGEDEDKLKEIIDIVREIKHSFNLNIHCTFSIFVPKVFTEYEYEEFISKKDYNKRIKILRDMKKYAIIDIENYNEALIQYIINHGNENCIKFIERISEKEPLSKILKEYNVEKIYSKDIPIIC